MLLHLAWRRNLDGFDVALAANRLAAHGAVLWWLGAPGPEHEPGDYLCEASGEAVDRLARFGVAVEPWSGEIPDIAIPLVYPRIALLAGRAGAYPHFAYFAMALARLGFDCALVDGRAIAAGGLRQADLVVLPGGEARWGLDEAEGVTGADAELRAFLGDRGAAIGSGGGAFCLSAGRPGWTGTAGVRPRRTHEQVVGGTGIVSLHLDLDSIGFGCPPALEVPYDGGPVYDVLDRSASSAARFDALVMAAPAAAGEALDDAAFARDMAGHTAILRAEGRRGRAVLFSPQPEMGDLVRKYVAFDSYVPRHLAGRGEAAMAEMLRRYRVHDAPAYRLILNAVHSLMLRRIAPVSLPEPIVPERRAEPAPTLLAMLDGAAVGIVPGDEPRAGLSAMLRDDLRTRLSHLAPRVERAERDLLPLGGPAAAIRRLWSDCETAAAVALAARAGFPESTTARLAALETAIALGEAWCRLAEAELHFAAPFPRAA